MPERLFTGRFVLEPREGTFDGDGYYRPSDYELATGWVSGFQTASTQQQHDRRDARAAFEAALLPALRRTPCVVAFSGGRDSSAVLAVATSLARRTGLPDPVPATHDFTVYPPAGNRTRETDFQHLLLAHLELREWCRFTDPAAYDVLGPPARRGLGRHGLLWPAQLHAFESMLQVCAGGGSLIIGEGGDEILGSQRITEIRQLLATRPRARRRSLRRLANTAAPAFERRRGIRRKLAAELALQPYLCPDVATDLAARVADDLAEAPLRWDRAVLRQTASRAANAALANLRRLCDRVGVSLHVPFLDAHFVGRLAAAGGWRGWTDRTAMMRMLFGDVLPDEICRRTTKAEFGAVAIGEASREFLAGWSGAGIDPDVVDPDLLRAAACGDKPPFGAQLLIQAAWLATQYDRLRELAARSS